MIYFAKIKKNRDGIYEVEFPDLEGCFSEGKTLEEAKGNAKEAMDAWLASHCDRELKVPDPKSRKAKTYYPIEVDLRIAFALSLRKVRLKRKLSQSLVAKELGISQQAYAKLETPYRSNPSLDTIQKITKALDLRFDFQLKAS